MAGFAEQESLERHPSQETARENNVHRLDVLGKSIILVGTAHVSGRSADQVARIIEDERPDAVCVELCTQRYESLLRYGPSRKVNLMDLVGGRAGVGLMWFVLWYFQKKVGDQLGIRPGTEIVRAVEAAGNTGADVHAVDREIQVTLDRAWSVMSLKDKMALAAQLALSFRSISSLGEQDIENLKQEGMVEKAVAELGDSHPGLRRVLVDERDRHMAGRIAATAGQKIVAVVGAAHVPGILRHLQSWAASVTSNPELQASLESTSFDPAS